MVISRIAAFGRCTRCVSELREKRVYTYLAAYERLQETKLPGAPPGAAAELERIRFENRQQRGYHAHVTGNPSSLPSGGSGQQRN